MPDVTFLIPTFNEYLNIERLVKKIENLKLKHKYNILFVDDNSSDGSFKKFTELKNNYININFIIRKSFKKDLTKSILLGLNSIETKYTLVMDCDLQHDLKVIPKMIQLMNVNKNHIIIGSRSIEELEILKRKYISFIGIWITKLLGIENLKDPLSGFFIIETPSFKKIAPKITSGGYKILLSIIFNLGKSIKIKEIKINFYPRKYEKSKLNLKILFLFVMQITQLFYQRLKKR